MKELINKLQAHGLIFKELKAIEPKALGSRKKITIMLGIDLKGYYHLIFFISKRSRILTKEAKELLELKERVAKMVGSTLPHCHLFIDAPLCSKAKAYLEQEGCKLYVH